MKVLYLKSVQNYLMIMASDGFDGRVSLSTNLLKYYVYQSFSYPKLLNLFNILQRRKKILRYSSLEMKK